MQNGKDVYVEKPVSHNVWEGRQLVNAAKKYNKVVQAGTQIRSGEGLREAVQWIQAGNLGKITAARGFCYKRRDSIGKTTGPQPIPATVNYDLWTGPAPLVPPHRNNPKNGPIHYDWHWVYLYGNGDVGNQGIHQMDVARWFLGESGLPRHSLSIGGRLGYIDDGDTPNTQVVIHDYATAPLIFEVRGLPKKAGIASAGGDPALNQGGGGSGMDNYRGVDIGNVIDCEGGSLITTAVLQRDGVRQVGQGREGVQGHRPPHAELRRRRAQPEDGGAVRTDRGGEHLERALPPRQHLASDRRSCRPGRRSPRSIKSDAKLSEAYGRMVEHLHANNVDLEQDAAHARRAAHRRREERALHRCRTRRGRTSC